MNDSLAYRILFFPWWLYTNCSHSNVLSCSRGLCHTLLAPGVPHCTRAWMAFRSPLPLTATARCH